MAKNQSIKTSEKQSLIDAVKVEETVVIEQQPTEISIPSISDIYKPLPRFNAGCKNC